MGTVVVFLALVCVVGLVIRSMVKDKKAGKSLQCGQDCKHCGGLDIAMENNSVIEQLKKQGFRITKQRKLLIDIILSETCSCCKEVYVLASKKDPGIGMATVYRTVDALEKIGVLKRGIVYQNDERVE